RPEAGPGDRSPSGVFAQAAAAPAPRRPASATWWGAGRTRPRGHRVLVAVGPRRPPGRPRHHPALRRARGGSRLSGGPPAHARSAVRAGSGPPRRRTARCGAGGPRRDGNRIRREGAVVTLSRDSRSFGGPQGDWRVEGARNTESPRLRWGG